MTTQLQLINIIIIIIIIIISAGVQTESAVNIKCVLHLQLLPNYMAIIASDANSQKVV